MDHPAIARLEVIGTSIEGRPIRAMMISDNAAQDEDELTVLFNGGHHPREVMTHEAVMDIIDYLTDNYGSDPQATALVDAYQIWCVPLVNPDGLELVFTEDNLLAQERAGTTTTTAGSPGRTASTSTATTSGVGVISAWARRERDPRRRIEVRPRRPSPRRGQ